MLRRKITAVSGYRMETWNIVCVEFLTVTNFISYDQIHQNIIVWNVIEQLLLVKHMLILNC